jgi:DUF4097 and DUF4098 domain-containing protein YvlB
MAFPALEGSFDRTLKVTGRVNLEVATGSGSIKIREGGSSVVEVHGAIQARDDWRSKAQDKLRYLESSPPIVQTGNTIQIGRIEDEAYRNNVSISYEILVPADTQVEATTGSGSEKISGVHGPVQAHTGSGSIALRDIGDDVIAQTGSGSIELDQVIGDMDATTGSGSIRGSGIAGSVKAQTGSGSITIAMISAERGGSRDAEVSTSSGSIDVTGVHGTLRAENGSGTITISGTPNGEWKVDSSSGGVRLQLDSDASCDLVAHASSGEIRVDLPFTTTGSATRHEIRGKVRGGGHPIDVRVGSGGIIVR